MYGRTLPFVTVAMLKASFLTIILSTLAYAAPLTSRLACADVTVVFARGTTEIPPIGEIVGPPFAGALEIELGGRSLNFIGVDYAADIAGFLEGGDPEGARNMANDVTSFANSCPNTAIVMSGYRFVISISLRTDIMSKGL
jgi:cutinase